MNMIKILQLNANESVNMDRARKEAKKAIEKYLESTLEEFASHLDKYELLKDMYGYDSEGHNYAAAGRSMHVADLAHFIKDPLDQNKLFYLVDLIQSLITIISPYDVIFLRTRKKGGGYGNLSPSNVLWEREIRGTRQSAFS